MAEGTSKGAARLAPVGARPHEPGLSQLRRAGRHRPAHARAARRLWQRRAPGDAGSVGAHRGRATRRRRCMPRAPSCFQARSSRCCIRGPWGARTTSRRSCASHASAERARVMRSRSASPSEAIGPPSCARPSRPTTRTYVWSTSPPRRRCTGGSPPADVHLISLRDDWAGVVVPSKFFASLAVGRPVLYAGPSESEIAHWVAENDLGLHLRDDEHSAGVVADSLHGSSTIPAPSRAGGPTRSLSTAGNGRSR